MGLPSGAAGRGVAAMLALILWAIAGQPALAEDSVETKNNAGWLLYQTEKQLQELDDTVPVDLKANIDPKLAALTEQAAEHAASWVAPPKTDEERTRRLQSKEKEEQPAQLVAVQVAPPESNDKRTRRLQANEKETIHQHVLEACSAGNATAVQGLLKAQAQPNADDVLGQTALMRAAHIGDPIVLKCLIKARASINAQNKDGYSAIFLAAVHGHEPAVRVLLRAKADLNQRSYQANSALDFAKHLGHKNITKLINEERERMRTVARASRRY